MRVVIDTNVVLSALLFRGRTSIIWSLWRNQAISPVATSEMFAEYARALTYPKFNLSENEIKEIFETEIWPYFVPVKPRDTMPPVTPFDPKDIPFVQAACTAGVTAVLSGDRHLLALHEIAGTPVLPPRKFVQRFFSQLDAT